MNVNFKKPRYVIPLAILPFLCLFFYVYSSNASKKEKVKPVVEGIQNQIGDVSGDIKKKGLSNKLDAYRQQYKEGDGYTAINSISEENGSISNYGTQYDQNEKRTLDSIDNAIKQKLNADRNMRASRYSLPYADQPSLQRQGIARLSQPDQDLAKALSNLAGNRNPQQSSNPQNSSAAPKEKDPMDIFKAQMAYMDSVSKDADPELKAELQRQKILTKAELSQKQQLILDVKKYDAAANDFYTLKPDSQESFITAVIDENVTGYAGSRIRIRLLEDITAGKNIVRKGTYLYAQITGFSDQRVTLTIKSILYDNKILPVQLQIYDTDGMSGLFVPQSAFREFTKELGGNSMQGVNIQGSSQNQSQFIMGSVDKIFQSTSSAIAGLIRKNKAKIKYNSYIYLIDPAALQKAQKNY